jgi:outer membrane protein
MRSLAIVMVLTALFAGSAWGGELQIAKVDMTALLKNFPETAKAESLLEEQIKEFDAEKKALMDEFQTSKDEFQTIREQLQNKGLKDDERTKLAESAEKKLRKLQEEEMSIRKKLDIRQKELNEEKMRIHGNVTRKLEDLISKVAKEKGYGLVLDYSGLGLSAMHGVVYSEGITDLSEDVLKVMKVQAQDKEKK